MAKKRPKKKRPDHQQIARRILDTLVPDAEPKSNRKAISKGRRRAR
jgi:hypothetical protein